MPIDRRITNGLAWTGALLVVAIPAADMAMSQFGQRSAPQVAVVAPQAEPDLSEAVEPSLPTPATERPKPVTVAAKPAAEPVAPVATREPASDPVTTSTARPQAQTGDAVDDFLGSGRALPSYISDGGSATSQQPAKTQPATPPTAEPVAPAVAAVPPAKPATAAAAPTATVAPEQTAALPRTRIVTFPTPVSERPPSVPRSQVAAQPPLIIDQPAPPIVDRQPTVITADDLEDWESGPLSEFLAARQGRSVGASSEYDQDGFFLDEAPNSSARFQRFPRAYEDDLYPFQ